MLALNTGINAPTLGSSALNVAAALVGAAPAAPLDPALALLPAVPFPAAELPAWALPAADTLLAPALPPAGAPAAAPGATASLLLQPLSAIESGSHASKGRKRRTK